MNKKNSCAVGAVENIFSAAFSYNLVFNFF